MSQMDIYSSKLSPAVDFAVGAFLLVIAILSIVGNLLVLIMAFKRASHMKPPELLSVNLALTDLGAAVFMYPLSVASAWSHRWLGRDPTCIYYGLAGFLFGVTSMMTLTVMAIVRFRVSFNLRSPKEKISRRTVKLLCLSTWLYALLWTCFPLLGWGRYGPEPFGVSCTLAWGEMKEEGFSFVISLFSFNIVGPSVIIIFCYFGIALRLYITYRNQITNTVNMHRRLFIIAVLISLGFIMAWTPYALVSLWSIFRGSEFILPVVAMLPCMFAKSSTVYNPLIYYIFSQTFQRELKQLCCRSKVCNASNRENNFIYLGCDSSKGNKRKKVVEIELGKALEGQSSFEKPLENTSNLA